jgi:predicted MFS family arabinose efflux permease
VSTPTTPATGQGSNRKHDPYAPLRYPNFRRLVLAHGMSTVAREAQIVVVGWQVYEITKDPLSLGLIGLAEALPMVSVALYAGHVADRANRRTIAVAGTLGLAVSAVALLLFTMSPALLHSVWPVYGVIFASGIARSFTRPAVTALSAELIPREIYPGAVAWRSSVWQIAAIAGPALGGMLYGFAGPKLAYGVVVVLFCGGLAALGAITHQSEPLAVDMPIGESLRVGIRFLLHQPVLLGAMTLDLFSVLFGGAVALLPIFAKMLGAGPEGLGILRAAPAIGSLVIGIYLAHRPPFRRAGPTLFIAVAVFGLTMIGFGLSRNFILSFALLVASGVADNVSVLIRGTLMQTLAPRELLGRVSSVNSIFIGASNEIGAFESGVAARLLGVVPSVIFGGCMTLLVVVSTAMASPRLRRLGVILSREEGASPAQRL